MPVAVTTIVAVPRVTEVFWNSMLCGRRAPTSAGGQRPRSLGIGALSPVSAASWVSSVAERTIRPSAGTMSPASSCDDVAGDELVAGTSASSPSRTHPGLRHLHLGQRVDARPGLQLLARAEHDVEHDEQPPRCTAVDTSPMSEADDGDRDRA